MLAAYPTRQRTSMLKSDDLAKKVAILDAAMFRIMEKMLNSAGPAESGLYDYYEARIAQRQGALSGYDKALIRYALASFDKDDRRIVHAGTGIGTLTAALAAAGFTIAGIERDESRARAATRIRDTLAGLWPADAARYSLIVGEYPTIVSGTSWMAPDVLLIFTNCVAGWSDQLTEKIIRSFASFGDVILDITVFGKDREDETERRLLVDLIRRQGLTAKPLNDPEMPSYACYYHVFRPPHSIATAIGG